MTSTHHPAHHDQPRRHHDHPDSGNTVRQPAPAQRLEQAAAALTAHGFTVEILDDAAAARARIKDLIPEGASVFTGASETLRLSGIDADINISGRYQAIKPQTLAMDRVTAADDIRRLRAIPDVVAGSVHAITETGSLVAASGTGSQLPAYAGGAARVIWIVGAQKVVPDLPAALRRVEDHCLPLETARTQAAYGSPAPSTACSSSAQNSSPGAAPSYCSAKPSDSEGPRLQRCNPNWARLNYTMRCWNGSRHTR